MVNKSRPNVCFIPYCSIPHLYLGFFSTSRTNVIALSLLIHLSEYYNKQLAAQKTAEQLEALHYYQGQLVSQLAAVRDVHHDF